MGRAERPTSVHPSQSRHDFEARRWALLSLASFALSLASTSSALFADSLSTVGSAHGPAVETESETSSTPSTLRKIAIRFDEMLR